MSELSEEYTNDSLLDIFIFETDQNIRQLEEITLENEQLSEYTQEALNEIFRIVHTIKGSSAMMVLNNLSVLAHYVEDMFSIIRENNGQHYDYSLISDLVLESIDFMKSEMEKIKAGLPPDGNEKIITDKISAYLQSLKKNCEQNLNITCEEKILGEDEETIPSPGKKEKNDLQGGSKDGNYYRAKLFFEEGCQMESLRALGVICQLQEFVYHITHSPEDLIDSENSTTIIQEQGLTIDFYTDKSYEQMQDFFMHTPLLRNLQLEIVNQPTQSIKHKADSPKNDKGITPQNRQVVANHTPVTTMISVNVNKLDQLMNLIGEMVIAQAMVIHNPDLNDLVLDNFNKAAQQLKKITSEMQDVIMSIRMIPLTTVFQKNKRIVRDMSKKLNKEVILKMVGEDTEVDKNIIEHISDPLMHLIRNALDHGIESTQEREAAGKPRQGMITLSARNEGREVLISVRDDGKGIDKNKLLASAAKKGLLTKDIKEMSDRDIYSLIFLPGFSTNSQVTEYSGRGVGMDVVASNIEGIGGRVSVESSVGKGTTITLRLPITLAIIEGMNLRVGNSMYTMPITDIRESFRASDDDIIHDPDGHELIMVRGNCYPIVRLYELFNIEPDSKVLDDGILIMVENNEKSLCLFVDELIGQQEVVVKALPYYIKRVKGLSGCTLLGNGSISLILDAANF
ncbi:MAG: chemotaxis protein CheW [Bacillota bacterium]